MKAAPVHPHLCGEDAFYFYQLPAVAAVHPHLCGEDSKGVQELHRGHGSPPPVWGRRPIAGRIARSGRFTPTCVGKTTTGDQVVYQQNGSPPPVWGRRGAVYVDWYSIRFTPTCVGKTVLGSGALSYTAVHPHPCGEDDPFEDLELLQDGSPPPVWGRPPWPAWACRRTRFTPTCVGKTSLCPLCSSQRAVHPHLCGEDLRVSLEPELVGGSPPPVWGRQEDRLLRR